MELSQVDVGFTINGPQVATIFPSPLTRIVNASNVIYITNLEITNLEIIFKMNAVNLQV